MPIEALSDYRHLRTFCLINYRFNIFNINFSVARLELIERDKIIRIDRCLNINFVLN